MAYDSISSILWMAWNIFTLSWFNSLLTKINKYINMTFNYSNSYLLVTAEPLKSALARKINGISCFYWLQTKINIQMLTVVYYIKCVPKFENLCFSLHIFYKW